MISNLISALVLGLLTPLGAVCVIPLYPGFVAYLANRTKSGQRKTQMLALGLTITLGVVSFMFLIGVIFSWLLKESLTKVINIISPIAFGFLALVSVLLIIDFDFSKIFKKVQSPEAKNPYLEGFFFGFFFGAIILPCNPLFIAILFTKSLLTVGFWATLLEFIFFGIGIGLPLIVLSAISAVYSKAIIGFLTKYQRIINITMGLIILFISLYYLISVFKIFG